MTKETNRQGFGGASEGLTPELGPRPLPDSDTGKPGKTGRRHLKSTKLHSTLDEIGNAFADWEAGKSAGGPHQSGLSGSGPSALGLSSLDGDSGDEEFRTKTRKLLGELKSQLADLSEVVDDNTDAQNLLDPP